MDLIVAAMNAAFSQFAADELRPLRIEIEQLAETVRGNGKPGLVQQVAILEERQRVAERDRTAAAIDHAQLQQRLYLLVGGLALALLGAVLSYVLR
ncbi:MAG: hypothetical protein JNG89_01605 [Planctomycetaceae bacterium]|nr:hypothetical protein [Planctomycetaceae bacterium]